MEYPWLEELIISTDHLPKLSSVRRRREFQDFVLTHIDKIQFCNWGDLDLHSHSSKFTDAPKTGRHSYAVDEYVVLWNCNSTLPFSHRKANGARFRPSVQDLIKDLIIHLACTACNGSEVCIDGVLKHRYSPDVRFSREVGESFTFYICPHNWMLESLSCDWRLIRLLCEKNMIVPGLYPVII